MVSILSSTVFKVEPFFFFFDISFPFTERVTFYYYNSEMSLLQEEELSYREQQKPRLLLDTR